MSRLGRPDLKAGFLQAIDLAILAVRRAIGHHGGKASVAIDVLDHTSAPDDARGAGTRDQ